jgi:hypothetical protein
LKVTCKDLIASAKAARKLFSLVAFLKGNEKKWKKKSFEFRLKSAKLEFSFFIVIVFPPPCEVVLVLHNSNQLSNGESRIIFFSVWGSLAKAYIEQNFAH